MALKMYKQRRKARILPILEKSIDPVPVILLTIPLNISVVAFPSILGPYIEKTVLAIANIITKKIDNLYVFKYFF